MDSTQPTIDERQRIGIGALIFTAGTLATAVAAAPAPLPQNVAQVPPPFVAHATQDSVSTSMIREGTLQGETASLISAQAKAVLGKSGVDRLASFMSLRPGWDGPSSRPVNLESVDVFSDFFASTGLRPPNLAVFLSARGNVVTNWLDAEGQLIELEFEPEGVSYFIERTEDEGIASDNSSLTALFDYLRSV